MKKKYSRYKMTLYVNLISPIVLMMLAVSVIVRPYLDHEEIRFIKEDKCIFFGEGYTSIEEQVMEKLRDRLTKVLNKLPVETK